MLANVLKAELLSDRKYSQKRDKQEQMSMLVCLMSLEKTVQINVCLSQMWHAVLCSSKNPVKVG